MIKASLMNYRQSPRKVRVVTNLIKGKKIDSALTVLSFMDKDAAEPIKKLIESALANAKHNSDIERDGLFVKNIEVNAGTVLKRRMPRARGTAYQIKKRTSHITLVLADQSEMKNSKKLKANTLTAKS